MYKSEITSSNIGIPQGSIIGPIFFIIFMNALCATSIEEDQYITNYADADLMQNASNLFGGSKHWFESNKLIFKHKYEK